MKVLALLCMIHCAFYLPTQAADKPYKRSSIVKAYRTSMKEKNYAQARKGLLDAIKQYPEAAVDPQLYKYQVDALNELIGGENRKIYLNNRPDTVAYFNFIYDIYLTGLQCDSLEQVAIAQRLAEGKKGQPRLRGGVQQTLLPYRKNLLEGGKFYYKRKAYADAFRFINLYVQTKSSDVFLDSKGTSIVADPDDMTEASVLAVLSAFGSSNYAGVELYLDESLKDDQLRPQLLEIGSKTAVQLSDTTQQVYLLERGFEDYPDVEYFFITLVKHYNDMGMYDHALQKVLRMTTLHPERRDYWYMAGTEQQLLERYEEALESYQKCLEIQADDAESYAAIGSIHLHAAHVAYAKFNLPLRDPSYARQKAAITQLYKQACQSFEQSRHFAENNPSLWLEGLRETYFKLNRGKALKALDKYQVGTN